MTTYPKWDEPVADWVEKPEPAAIWQIIGGHSLYWALVAAIELRVFDELAPGPLSLEEMSGQLDADADRLATLLDALVSVGLLDGSLKSYALNKTLATLLVTTSDRYMGDVVVHSPGIDENWPVLADAIRSGEPRAPIDEAFYERFARASFLTQLRGARFVATRLGFNAATKRHVLDLGAGGAPWSIALLEGSPKSTATINDLAAVVPVAEQKCREYGVADRCEFIGGDYHEVSLEACSFDTGILGHVLRAEEPADAISLLRRVATALRPGGQLVVADYFVGNDRRGPPQALLLGLTMVANTPHGKTYTHSEMASWLADACFGNVRTLETVKNNHVLVASKEVP